jgi:hypothetical protein
VIVQTDNGYSSLLLEYKHELNGTPGRWTDGSYSAEEIRFNLLAIAQRPLPLLKTQLHHLITLQSGIINHLNSFLSDWSIFSDSVPAADKVDSSLIEKAVTAGVPQYLLALKKALDRDIAITNRKVADEEEKISQHMVCLWVS